MVVQNQLKLEIDRQQTITQLEMLGYQQGDAVYVRAFLPKEDPRYAPNTGRKADRLNWEQVEQWQAQGYGVYIVVNGGGHKDEDVKSCRAIFCEFDDRPIEDQINFWQDLGLPEPSMQIATRKSVHSYWVFNEPISVEQWRELQAALLTYTASDPALKNPSRVMRLAGAYHIKPGCDPLRCDIIHSSDKRYSYEELRAAIPIPVQPQSLANKSKRYKDISIPVPASVPLEACLAKESRHLLDSGVGEGGRNAQGAKLARDLIGTANYLQAIGQSFDGDPKLLLEDYANRCSPPLPSLEVETIWKSAEKDNPTPSCTPEGVDACIRGWYWQHCVKPQESTENNNYTAGRGFSNSNNGNGGNKPSTASVSLCDRISPILSRYESESETASALMDLASATGRTYNEINSLAKIIRAEGELATEVIAAVKSFQGILKSCRKRLDLGRYLEKSLFEPLMAKAAAMPTAPEYLFNTAIASTASRIGTAAKVVINPAGDYAQPCIFWTANVAHSGQAKTPPQQVILKPLEKMEESAKETYDIQMEDYEKDDDGDRKPPVRRRRLLNNVTTSTKIRIHDENPRGLLEYLDELVADYQRLNQFKNGKGDDLQLELSFWNGSGGNFDRHDARLFLARTALSKTGTYQWDTLARLMADEVNFIASGYSSRFLYCSILDAPARYLDLLSHQSADTLKKKLQWLYEELEKLPEADYSLDREAKVLFQGWNHALVNAEIEETHFGLSLVYAKIESYTARIALWLHIVNAVLRGDTPAPSIDGETMQHAIEIASFYLWQHKLIHAHNAPNRQLEGLFLKVQTQAEKFFTKCSKGVGASFLKTRINALKNWAVEKIRCSIFQPLAAAGHGRIEGEGSEMVYIPNTQSDASGKELVAVGGELVTSPIVENTTNTDFQTLIGEFGEQATTIITSKQPDEAFTSPSTHQFTNSTAQSFANTGTLAVGEVANSSPIVPIAPSTTEEPQQLPTARDLAAKVLGCSTWVELAQQVDRSAKNLMKVASCMSSQQRDRVVNLLTTHLCSAPDALSQLAWIPEKLRDAALKQLSFTIRQMRKSTASLELYWEHISNCQFVCAVLQENDRLRWTFQTPDGITISVLDLKVIEAIAYTQSS
ncbi:DNA primase [Cyanosarcina cf. burmensis CCALA 770]|nr:DNA primase [Cyanosarcina cf. burmensis CCALA 770]